MSKLDEEKLFYERFYALHRDPVLLSVCKEFGIGVFRRSSVLEGFDEFLREQKFSGDRCMEIGTCNGLTALVLSRYFKEVVTIDVAPNNTKRAVAKFAGADNIKFVDVKNNAEKAKAIQALKFDAAYSDGDHARDAISDFELVKHSGRVLFHEFWEAQPAVVNLVHSLRSGRITTKGKLALWIA